MVCVKVRSLRHFWLDLLPESLAKKLAFVKPLLFPEEFAGENVESAGKSGAASVDKPADEVQRNVIVIGRQFGSGGHDIGKALAEKLGYAFYDQEIIEMTAGNDRIYTGIYPEKRRDDDQQFPV